jgi:hypothetical protein
MTVAKNQSLAGCASAARYWARTCRWWWEYKWFCSLLGTNVPLVVGVQVVLLATGHERAAGGGSTSARACSKLSQRPPIVSISMAVGSGAIAAAAGQEPFCACRGIILPCCLLPPASWLLGPAYAAEFRACLSYSTYFTDKFHDCLKQKGATSPFLPDIGRTSASIGAVAPTAAISEVQAPARPMDLVGAGSDHRDPPYV